MTDDIAAKLKRLAELETEFDAAVERAKIAATYQLAYGLSHEFNNPLANISSRAQALLVDEHDPERRRKLAAINVQAFRAHEMIADLMLFAKPPQLERASCDVVELLARAKQEMQSTADQQQTEIALAPSGIPNSQFNVDATALLEAVKAVVKNALEALGEGGRIELTLQTAEHNHAPAVAIVIADNGPGIAEDVRPHIFDPYFSGREAGRGLGLGLCKCYRILDEHGGAVAVDSTMGQGTVFKLILPLSK
jgi:signal transduction histidine kinase